MFDVLSKILALLEERGTLSLGNFQNIEVNECVASDVGMVGA